MLPSLSLPPLECCLGTSPTQAEKLRPDRKAFGSAMLATRAVPNIGPTPGIASSRLLASSPRQQCREPWPMFGAMDLGIADDGKCAGHEQAAQIAVALLTDTAEPVLAPARMLLRHEPDPG